LLHLERGMPYNDPHHIYRKGYSPFN